MAVILFIGKVKNANNATTIVHGKEITKDLYVCILINTCKSLVSKLDKKINFLLKSKIKFSNVLAIIYFTNIDEYGSDCVGCKNNYAIIIISIFYLSMILGIIYLRIY